MIFVRIFGVLSILICVFCGFGQGTKKISLNNQQISCEPLRFHVEKVIDRRLLRSTIGVIQKGINNKPRVADFDEPFENELMRLIASLKESDGQLVNVAMKIDNLEIEEVTTVKKEYAAARLSVDFFLVLDDALYFIIRKHSYIRSHGLDVTHQHDNNIAASIEKIMRDFNNINLDSIIIKEDPISWNEIASFQPKELPPPDILNGSYPDGIYVTFDQFLNNEPEIINGYQIDNQSHISLHWIDQQGKRTKLTTPVYAIAYQGRLYKYHNKDFYLIERRGDKLMFLGEPQTSPGQSAFNYTWGGIIASAATSSFSKIVMVYEIDLVTGEIREQGYTKR